MLTRMSRTNTSAYVEQTGADERRSRTGISTSRAHAAPLRARAAAVHVFVKLYGETSICVSAECSFHFFVASSRPLSDRFSLASLAARAFPALRPPLPGFFRFFFIARRVRA